MENIIEEFGCMVFDDKSMKERLPKDTYQAVRRTMEDGRSLRNLEVANVVANAMKDWAIEKGVTHYTHWFQPMTGVTAEKHESFLNINGGEPILEFSGKELIKGEPDASSFPNGGLRATFEARGYTCWDPTSYAFIKDNTLCIPTVFASWGGEALDKKTPLLRSEEALNRQALRVLHAMGKTDISHVFTSAGPEQEYFLIDKNLFDKREDLIFCGRTLFGAKPPKGQELDDHYFGSIHPRIASFMEELDHELWKLGVYAKTKHNEVAPSQYELAVIFTRTNKATDQNQLVMELCQRIAARHNLACLLHEKPFAGVNGSGKHNNWSISTNTGLNLLDPGSKPAENPIFMIFLAAVIKAVDNYQDLLRWSCASASNDHRLGASEAPPAIVSIFLGDDMMRELQRFINGDETDEHTAALFKQGVHTLPLFEIDTTDRNRTSPFAFTGNKFEFRMPGSMMSVSDCNVVLNTITAESLCDFADQLEKAEDISDCLRKLVAEVLEQHKRIIFNGNNYAAEWVDEAKKRGLCNLKTAVDAFPCFIAAKNIALFAKHKIYNESEQRSRYLVQMENYSKVLTIEALTMLDMVDKQILPAVIAFTKSITDAALAKKALSATIDTNTETALVEKLSSLATCLYTKKDELEKALNHARAIDDTTEQAIAFKEHVLSAMNELRAVSDELETIVSKESWPFPTYNDLLYKI